MDSSAPIEVRRVRVSDASVLRQVRLRALELDPAAFAASLDENRARPESHWKNRASESGSSDTKAEFLALDSDGTAVGLVGALRIANHRDVAELVAMWIEPAFRGRGVAVGMIEAVLDWCTSVGVLEVELWVAPGNDGATRLYERCGFTQQPPRKGAEQYDRFDTYLSLDLGEAAGNVASSATNSPPPET
ncbi:MAG: GNAT family N-acetyltransferase [Actinobacteria bacterium]|nr:GNAT family N-acetyltransferase [Actinomycetota bacterium]